MDGILKRLKEKYTVNIHFKDNPFEMFIRTILSQNTNDTNRDRAYKRLKENFDDLTPENLANADLKKIEDAIKVAGLYRIKSVRIHEISKYIMDNFDGNIVKILNLPFKEARKKLIELKGIGYKTADIMLLFYCDHPTIPIDTHITRVSKRLGFVEQDEKYEKIRESLEKFIETDSSVYKESHLLLIELGRDTCNAIKPKCKICIVESLCPKLIKKRVKKKVKKKVKSKSKKKSKKKTKKKTKKLSRGTKKTKK
ncbi:MAG: endonuclease III [Candidatus Helarchaeota archaeon]|nr:endonuclease III [Candidatus Helarchaeota archaeon]